MTIKMLVKRVVPVALALVAALAVGAAWRAPAPARADDSQPSASPAAPLLGKALADSLNLQVEHGFTGDCGYYVQFDDGTGYCLDSAANTDVERYAIGQELRGRVPPPEELTFYEDMQKLSNMSVDDPEYQHLRNTALADRQALLEAQG